VLRGINSSAGRTIVTKYGTKRGVVALGTALPFGIGAAAGGDANHAIVRLLARHADKFFKNLPPELRGLVARVAACDGRCLAP